jgi:hypothetical protein
MDDGRLLLRRYMNADASAAITTAATARGLDGDDV